MLYIVTALYIEAEPFIKELRLKKKNGYGKYQVFKNENIVLVITGVGSIESASAISYIFGRENAKKEDIVINFGICAGNKNLFKIGDIILCNKITDFSTGKTYYPDILYKHQFLESEITTFPSVVTTDKQNIKCADMEAAGFYIAVSSFVFQHNIHIIKIISDYMDETVNKDAVSKVIKSNSDKIINWINNRNTSKTGEAEILNGNDISLINNIIDNLKLTQSMKYELIKLSQKYKIRNDIVSDKLELYIDIKSRNKKEGKILYDKIRSELAKF